MLEKTIGIKSFDVFPSGVLKPSALMRHMQQIAREDCDAMGCTYGFMRSLNTVFVLTRLAIEFLRPVKDGEELVLKTYNNSITGIIFDREYELVSDGTTVARASTFWTLVRYDKRSLVRPKDFPVKFESLGLDIPSIEMPKRFDDSGLAEREIRRVRVSDLDENNHLNNCIYSDIALDAAPGFNGLDSWVRSVKLIFRREARLGDELAVSAAERDGVLTVFAKKGQETCFEAEIVTERIEG